MFKIIALILLLLPGCAKPVVKMECGFCVPHPVVCSYQDKTYVCWRWVERQKQSYKFCREHWQHGRTYHGVE